MDKEMRKVRRIMLRLARKEYPSLLPRSLVVIKGRDGSYTGSVKERVR
jgi:hypothetical protein